MRYIFPATKFVTENDADKQIFGKNKASTWKKYNRRSSKNTGIAGITSERGVRI